MMSSSYQGSHSSNGVNVLVPAPRAQELFKSLFVAGDEASCFSHRSSQSISIEPDATFNSPTINNCSVSSSTCLPPPPLQLSTSTLFPLNFPSSDDESNKGNVTQDNASLSIKTPCPHGAPIPGSWTIGATESYEALKRHMKACQPKVTNASKRLQQILGMRNEDPFTPPEASLHSGQAARTVGSVVDFNPALKHLRGSNAGLGMQIGSVGYDPGHGKRQRRTNLEIFEQKQRAGGTEILQGQQQDGLMKPLPLRETLLMHGRQPYGNQAKTELRSITFHDLTPDMRTGIYKNELLAHFESDEQGRTRIISYEVDVPVSSRQQPIYSSNQLFPTTERWIAFIISTPVITFKPSNTTHNSNAPAALPPNLSATTTNGQPPVSWLMFAAPLRAIRSHPPSKDSIIARDTDGNETLRPVHRYDYDFSYDGVPSFEFVDKATILGRDLGAYLDCAIGGPFLTAKDMGAYEAGGDFISRLRKMARAADVGEEEEGDDDGNEAEEEEEKISPLQRRHNPSSPFDDERVSTRQKDPNQWKDGHNLEQDMSHSQWWSDAQTKFAEDSHAWARIRESMTRGCCRVVVRVEEEAQRYRGAMNGVRGGSSGGGNSSSRSRRRGKKAGFRVGAEERMRVRDGGGVGEEMKD